jgi:hypothetical protein
LLSGAGSETPLRDLLPGTGLARAFLVTTNRRKSVANTKKRRRRIRKLSVQEMRRLTGAGTVQCSETVSYCTDGSKDYCDDSSVYCGGGQFGTDDSLSPDLPPDETTPVGPCMGTGAGVTSLVICEQHGVSEYMDL